LLLALAYQMSFVSLVNNASASEPLFEDFTADLDAVGNVLLLPSLSNANSMRLADQTVGLSHIAPLVARSQRLLFVTRPP